MTTTTLPAPYFSRDGITIYHADCNDILPEIDPAGVSLLLTDPPYGINFNTDHTRFGPTSKRSYQPITGDGADFDPKPLLAYPRVALFGGNFYSSRLPEGSWIVWVKRTLEAVRDKGIPLSPAELLWHNCPGNPVDLFEWYWMGAYRKGEMGVHIHPTQKPVALMRWLLEKWTEPGDLILDPYMGSGPIAQACLELGRRYIGVEIVEDYCRVTVQHRLGQPSLFT